MATPGATRPARTNEPPEMQEVYHTAGRPSRTGDLESHAAGLVCTSLNKQVMTPC